MNFVDVIIAVFALALAAIGYERGLIASGLPLAGFVLGAAIGGRLGPALLAGGGESPYAPLITVLAGLVLGAALAVVVEGFAQGLSARLSRGGVGGAAGRDRGRRAARRPGAAARLGLRRRGPQLARARRARPASRASELPDPDALNDVLPPSGPLLNVLRHIDPTPTVRGPNANVRAPERGDRPAIPTCSGRATAW